METGNVDQRNQWHVETVAEPHESGRLGGSVDVEDTGQERRLVTHQADGPTAHPAEPDHYVGGVGGLDFHEFFVVHDAVDNLTNIVRAVGLRRYDGAQGVIGAVGVVGGAVNGGIIEIVQRQETDQPAHFSQTNLFGVVDEMRHTAAGTVGIGSTQLVVGNVLSGYGPHHVGAGDVHLPGAPHHEDEVGDGRRINRAACRWPHDYRDLRNDAGIHGVAQEYVAVGGEAQRAFLDAGASGVADADHRAPGFGGQVHDLADFLPDHLGEGTAEHGKVLGVGEYLAPVDIAVSSYHRITEDSAVGEAEIGGSVGDETVDFLESAFVHQDSEAFAGSEFAALVLLVDTALATAQSGLFTKPDQVVQVLIGDLFVIGGQGDLHAQCYQTATVWATFLMRQGGQLDSAI